MFGNNLFDECVAIIKAWKLKQQYPDEKYYKKELLNLLQEKLNEQTSSMFSQKQHFNIRDESGRSLCDIGINRKVGIELKKGKNGKIPKTEINRLQGQIEDYELDYPEGVIVVLVGECDKFTESEIRTRLQRKLDKENNIGIGIGQQFRIKLINKSHSSKGDGNLYKKKSPLSFDIDIPDYSKGLDLGI